MSRRLEDISRWPPAASWAVGLLLIHVFLVLIQATLAFRADLADSGDIRRAVGRVLGVVILTRALVRGRRWAWWVTAVWSGLLGVLGLLALIAVSVAVRTDALEADLVLSGAVNVALAAGIVLTLTGTFCALVIGLIQHRVRRPQPAVVLAGNTTLLPRQPSALLGPILLLATVLAGALGLAAFMEARDGRLGVPDSAAAQASDVQPPS